MTAASGLAAFTSEVIALGKPAYRLRIVARIALDKLGAPTVFYPINQSTSLNQILKPSNTKTITVGLNCCAKIVNEHKKSTRQNYDRIERVFVVSE